MLNVTKGSPNAPPSFLTKLRCMVSPKKPSKLHIPIPIPSPSSAETNSGEFDLVFHYFDVNGDGKISPVELRSCMLASGEEMSPEEAEDAIRSSDSDGDGLLGIEDFSRLIRGEETERGLSLREAFRAYEMGGQGCITPKSLKRALSRLGEKRTVGDCRRMIRRFDLDGDGTLSFEEFRTMMTV